MALNCLSSSSMVAFGIAATSPMLPFFVLAFLFLARSAASEFFTCCPFVVLPPAVSNRMKVSSHVIPPASLSGWAKAHSLADRKLWTCSYMHWQCLNLCLPFIGGGSWSLAYLMVVVSSFLMVPLLLIALLGSYPSVAFSMMAAFSLSSFSAEVIATMNLWILAMNFL